MVETAEGQLILRWYRLKPDEIVRIQEKHSDCFENESVLVLGDGDEVKVTSVHNQICELMRFSTKNVVQSQNKWKSRGSR